MIQKIERIGDAGSLRIHIHPGTVKKATYAMDGRVYVVHDPTAIVISQDIKEVTFE